MSDEPRLQSFEEFWPYYLGEHLDPTCRVLHYFGTGMALTCATAAAVTLNPLWLIPAPVLGYGPAWVGHLFFEKNRPATFTYPRWSLLGDFKMFFCFVRGKMGEELAKHHPSAVGASAPAAK